MNKPFLCGAAALCAAVFAAAPRAAWAQQTITCASEAGSRATCNADARGGAYLVRSLGRSPCVFNRTWGFTGSGVWAANGCQGRFVVDRPPSRIPVTGLDALRICRNFVAARLAMPGPSGIRADLRSSNLRGDRVVKWLAGEGTGTCFVNRNGEMTAWRSRGGSPPQARPLPGSAGQEPTSGRMGGDATLYGQARVPPARRATAWASGTASRGGKGATVMTLATLLPLLLKVSIAGTVLAVALRAQRRDVMYVLRDSGKFARSFFSMLVLMPLLALALGAALDLHPAVKVALVGLALAPVPPMLPRKEIKAGGHGSYAVGLLFATALFSIVTVPMAVHLVGDALGEPRTLPVAKVWSVVLASVIGPLALGVAVRTFAPTLAERVSSPVGVLSTLLLALGCVPILAVTWRPMLALVGNGTLLAIAVFALAGLAAGHLLGGPRHQDRVVLALSTAARHPVIAVTASQALYPGHREVVPAVLLYLLVSGLVSAVYIHLASRPTAAERRARTVPPAV
ncbi:DUF3011 domain-containing protein [Longimicrobium sp.]|uniref:DUF3011 domain-containing protein n=1 Tax=Longimicrobium sp. TaxID=2029185 RepID=UPI002E3771AC|nr:DUF3011 domain-containing protein [Longimicrobium sp.]HEX6041533.1 DUF3011 domain-containing protein [Longimicrobium sp.]